MKLNELRQYCRQVRQSKCLSAKALAIKIKSTESNILNFETGKANITFNLLERILNELCIDFVTKVNH